MPTVDPDDDSIWTWVLQNYRFVPQRRQRRWVPVAAYDNQTEFEHEMDAYDRQLRAEIDAGDRDPRERVMGTVWHPGHRAEQIRARMISDAIAHGANWCALPDDGPLPSNVAVFGWDDDGEAWSVGGSQPPTPPNHWPPP